MRSLENNRAGSTLLAAASGSPAIPPATCAIVPSWWNALAGAVPEFSLRLQADGTTNLTAATLYAGILVNATKAALTAVADMAATKASLAMSTASTNSDSVIRSKVAGSAGNLIQIRFVPGSVVNAGTLDESAFPQVTFNYKSGTTTETNFETAITGSTHLEVATPGTGANVLSDPGDTFGFTSFAGGYDANTLVKTAHGFITGAGPVRLTKTAGSDPSGLLEATDYWVIQIDANHFKLAASVTDALNVTPITFTGTGSDQWTVTPTGAFQAVMWHQHATLGLAGDGAVALGAAKAYAKLGLRHSPAIVAYALAATSSDTSKLLSCVVEPLREL